VNVPGPVPLQQSGGPASDLLLRTGSSVVLLTLALGAAYAGGIVAAIVAAFFAVVVLFEWVRLTGGKIEWAAGFAVAVVIAVLAVGTGHLLVACAVAVFAALVAAALFRGTWLPAGILYSSALGVGIMAIREAPDYGFAALFFVLAVVWATDSGAFFAGRYIGGPKLSPIISPKKTWAGAIGGLVAAALAGCAAARLTQNVPLTLPLVGVALVLSVFCQAGDLYESWIKRHFGAKDSGNIIPGHGGIMDRVDGLIFALAAAIGIGAAHGGADGIGRGLLLW
jgi:phosphatidate cytidylyltransferase